MAWTEDDEALAGRIREALPAPLEEKKMFGGLAFLDRGHMALGVTKGRLMVRVGPALHEEALARPGAAPMDFAHRPMTGMVFVTGEGLADLDRWVSDALGYSATLPAKAPKAPKAPKAAKAAKSAKAPKRGG